MNKNDYSPKVVVCPLDWGLGHATRCIPIIRELLSQGAEVVIAGEGSGMNLLRQEFPDLKQEILKGYRIKFSRHLPIGAYLILIVPRLIFRIIKEHNQLAQLVLRINADAVISDNRYGLWHKGTYNVFITHQPNIIPFSLLNFTKSFLRRITRYYIKKYNECWIPDFAVPPGLSGDLSHGYGLPDNVKYVGPLSRFDKERVHANIASGDTGFLYEIVAVISGPEPHRTRFEELLVEQITNTNLKSLLVRGITEVAAEPRVSGNLTIVNHLRSSEMYNVLAQSNVVICRAGYSTLMDLSFTGNRVICIPTPGQSEQEYLADSLSLKGFAVSCSENNFNLNDCYNSALNTSGLPVGSGKLTEAIALLLHKIIANKRT